MIGTFGGADVKVVVAESKSKPLPALTVHPASWGNFFNTLRQNYLDHHYAFRDVLISWNNYFDIFVMLSSSPNSRVLIGKDRWLFLKYDSVGRNIQLDAQHPEPLSQTKLAELAKIFEERRVWLAERGIRYVVLLPPSKNTVYPEKLPHSLQPTDPGRHLRELIAYLRAHTQVDIVDVTPSLLDHKKDGFVFFARDNHWNALGAFVGYTELARHLQTYFPAIKLLERQQFREETYRNYPGDLASMTGLTTLFKEDRTMFVNTKWYKARGASYDGPMQDWYLTMPQRSVLENPALPRALVLHDSFWLEMMPFIGESFREALYIWALPPTQQAFRRFDKQLIERFKPDVVIDEFAERYIMITVR